MIRRFKAKHEGRAIQALLDLLAQDIQAGIRVRQLSEDLARSMLEQAGGAVGLDGEIEGAVAL